MHVNSQAELEMMVLFQLPSCSNLRFFWPNRRTSISLQSIPGRRWECPSCAPHTRPGPLWRASAGRFTSSPRDAMELRIGPLTVPNW